MKRFAWVFAVVLSALWSLNAWAGDMGVVDMRQIFEASPQVKAINADLDKKFSGQRNDLVTKGKALQDDVKKLQRNESVMSKKDVAALKDKIAEQEAALRTEQAQFQKTLYAAQNDAMNTFMEKVKGVVAAVAKQKKLDMVLPKNAVVYSQDKMDITADVTAKLK